MAAMGTENEVKFEVSSGDLQKLAASRSLRPSDGQLPEHKYLVSTYFDTPKQTLRRNGVSLRVRQAGKKRIQTIKTATDGIALGRGEWEHRLDSNEPDLRAARGTALEPLLSKDLCRDLDPVFATHVHRTLVPLRPGNSRVELALDQGHVRAGRNSTPLAEVELELKSGSLADLFRAARMVAELVPAKLVLRSKSEQGYDLIADQPVSAAYASRISLPRKTTLAYAFQVIGRSVLRHIAANEPAVLAGQAEGVHQMRIGVRRLRAAIWVFSELLGCKQTETIKHDLKWLAGKLGSVRDLDVFLDGKVKRLAAAEPPIAGVTDLTRELDYRRALAAESARTAVASSRYRLLIFNALEWIEDGTWLRRSRAHRNRRIKPFAADLFERRTKKTRKRANKIHKLDVHDRHKLRIAVKKLRYTIYFFESLFGGSAHAKALARYKDHLESLQDKLGALNDIAVHHKLVTRFGTDNEEKKSQLVAFAAGAIVGSERNEIGPLLDAAGKAARKLRRAKEFWV
jgi:inorganic triphosphatase YgiF